jgi:hypothetical protein
MKSTYDIGGSEMKKEYQCPNCGGRRFTGVINTPDYYRQNDMLNEYLEGVGNAAKEDEWITLFCNRCKRNGVRKEFLATPEYTELQLEAAQCIWEHVTENRDREDLSPAFDRLGTPKIRHWLRNNEILSACEKGWSQLSEDEKEAFCPYDWAYVPFFVDNCLNWEDLLLRHDWKEIIKKEAARLVEAENARVTLVPPRIVSPAEKQHSAAQ